MAIKPPRKADPSVKAFRTQNWQQETGYPNPKDLDHSHWRWEFLRRSPKYQGDWERMNNQDATDLRTWKEQASHEKLKLILNKYGLKTVLPNPAQSTPLYLQFQEPAEQVFIGGIDPKGNLHTLQIPPLYGAVRFDLAKPLPPQLNLAKKTLLGTQETLTGTKLGRRKHPSHWPLLLRILDARAVDISYGKIGAFLLRHLSYADAAARAKQLHTEALRLSSNFPF